MADESPAGRGGSSYHDRYIISLSSDCREGGRQEQGGGAAGAAGGAGAGGAAGGAGAAGAAAGGGRGFQACTVHTDGGCCCSLDER